MVNVYDVEIQPVDGGKITETHFKLAVTALHRYLDTVKHTNTARIVRFAIFSDALVAMEEVEKSLELAKAVTDLRLKGFTLRFNEYIFQFFPYARMDVELVVTW